jgi:hypothetical protein
MIANIDKQYIKLIVIFGILLSTVVYGQQGHSRKMPKLDCGECHTCENPTPANLCLKACPSLFTMETKKAHDVSEAPDSMLLDKLMNQYGPVRFNHKVHATMSDMGNGCPTCHHFSPAGKIPKCGDCHSN